jgi:hypothetical protein
VRVALAVERRMRPSRSTSALTYSTPGLWPGARTSRREHALLERSESGPALAPCT